MKRDVYLAIPSWASLYRAGEDRKAFSVTILQWDLGCGYSTHEEGGELLFLVPRRGERKQLRDTLKRVYGFEARTVIKN